MMKIIAVRDLARFGRKISNVLYGAFEGDALADACVRCLLMDMLDNEVDTLRKMWGCKRYVGKTRNGQ